MSIKGPVFWLGGAGSNDFLQRIFYGAVINYHSEGEVSVGNQGRDIFSPRVKWTAKIFFRKKSLDSAPPWL